MARTTRITFKTALRRFEAASPWLSDEHEPALTALRAMAEVLDSGKLTPAMLSQWGLAYRALARERPTAADVDPLSAALAEAEAS